MSTPLSTWFPKLWGFKSCWHKHGDRLPKFVKLKSEEEVSPVISLPLSTWFPRATFPRVSVSQLMGLFVPIFRFLIGTNILHFVTGLAGPWPNVIKHFMTVIYECK